VRIGTDTTTAASITTVKIGTRPTARAALLGRTPLVLTLDPVERR
jgi:hypothetical protein